MLEKYLDLKTVASGVIAIVVFLVLWMLYNKFVKKDTTISAAQYAALTEEEKKKYALDSITGRYKTV